MSLKIRIRDDEPLHCAIRRFKKAIQRAGIMKEAANRSYFMTPSQRRRYKDKRRLRNRKTN